MLVSIWFLWVCVWLFLVPDSYPSQTLLDRPDSLCVCNITNLITQISTLIQKWVASVMFFKQNVNPCPAVTESELFCHQYRARPVWLGYDNVHNDLCATEMESNWPLPRKAKFSISMQSDQALYCWLTFLKFLSWYPWNDNGQFQKWKVDYFI